jgi:hypothetical protein
MQLNKNPEKISLQTRFLSLQMDTAASTQAGLPNVVPRLLLMGTMEPIALDTTWYKSRDISKSSFFNSFITDSLHIVQFPFNLILGFHFRKHSVPSKVLGVTVCKMENV